MKIAAIVFLSLMAPLLAATAAADAKGKRASKIIFKGLCSLCFVIAAAMLFSISDGARFRLLILLGLIFGMLGDVALSLTPARAESRALVSVGNVAPPAPAEVGTGAANAIGMLFFVVAHLLYATAFFMLVRVFQLGFLALIVGLPAIVGAAFACGWLDTRSQAMKYGGVFYALVISVTLAAAADLTLYDATLRNSLITAGTALFAASDLMLAILNFNSKAPRKILFPIVLTLYYAGQALIATSVAY